MKRGNLSAGERWIGFLRGYGPVNRVDNMYAETIQALANRYQVAPLQFEHPLRVKLDEQIDPRRGILTNIVLTGTAGDGKTSLCNALWHRITGDPTRTNGTNVDDYLCFETVSDGQPVRLHFIFEFSGFAPAKDEPWPPTKRALLDLFARSVLGQEPHDFFIIAANDGKLLQVQEDLPKDSEAEQVWALMESWLAHGVVSPRAKPQLEFHNLSRMATRDLLERALVCLLEREEWSCLNIASENPAFGPQSPLFRNHAVLSDREFQERLLAVADLCDANELHVSIREILLLLVNALLGDAKAPERVMRSTDLKKIAGSERSFEASIYRNLFGENLRENRRLQYAVFRHLGSFRIGLETTNSLDTLIIFGRSLPALQETYANYLASDPVYGQNPRFERLLHEYIQADEKRNGEEGATNEFLSALADERRRLFFRLPEDLVFDPWRLTMFQSAGSYRQHVLEPLRSGSRVQPMISRSLVRGLNRIWTGMLAGESDTLWVTTSLGSSLAPISEVLVRALPISPSRWGEKVDVILGGNNVPRLRLCLGGNDFVDYPLQLTRYEYLTRVANGALPSSFSKECNEDVLAFKSRMVSECLRLAPEDVDGVLSPFEYIRQRDEGDFEVKPLGAVQS